MKDIPLTVTSRHIFEAGDRSAASLFSKVEAWLNFQALRNNWFGDESKILEVNFVFLPERQFLAQSVSDNWNCMQQATLTAVYGTTTGELEYDCYIMLANDELKYLMEHPSELEPTLCKKLSAVANEIAKPLYLTAI